MATPMRRTLRSDQRQHGGKVSRRTDCLRRARKIIRGLKDGLTEEERYAVADHVVAQLKERGDPWRLNEEAPTAEPPSA
jgi:hypothetical protein